MSVPFQESRTRENLMRAFAGESQAANRYLFAASQAKKSGLAVIQGVFLFTAGQERAHAKQFYRALGPEERQNIRVEGNYPVDLGREFLSQLRAAEHNELQEWEEDYAGFAKTAGEEGYPMLEMLFRNIAGVEKTHAERFGRYADLLEKGELFVSAVEETWMCLHCGYVTKDRAAPALCPVCGHPQGYFIRAELRPFV